MMVKKKAKLIFKHNYFEIAEEGDHVLCAKGYPGRYKKNLKINNLHKIRLFSKDFIYHAGTKYFKNEIRSDGGRVLNITSIGNSFKNIRSRIINIIKSLNWKQGFYRRDIGWKVINKNENH